MLVVDDPEDVEQLGMNKLMNDGAGDRATELTTVSEVASKPEEHCHAQTS